MGLWRKEKGRGSGLSTLKFYKNIYVEPSVITFFEVKSLDNLQENRSNENLTCHEGKGYTN